MTFVLTEATERRKPVDMLLYCPACDAQHIDAPDTIPKVCNVQPGVTPRWTNPPHRSHLCHQCGHIWRPADVATNGVASITTKGEHDATYCAPGTL